MAYKADTDWNRGIPRKILKLIIKLYFFSPYLLFYLMYQKGHHMWDILRLNEYIGLWGRYILKHGYPLYFFKSLIQLYLLHSFLYSLAYYIKEVIKGKIFWILNVKVTALRQLRPETGEYLAICFKTLIQLYCFFHFSIFDLLYQREYQR